VDEASLGLPATRMTDDEMSSVEQLLGITDAVTDPTAG
jgi:hypothetical protein